MIGFKYFQFLWLNIAKKKATWIVGLAYLFIIALLLFIVPFAMHKTPFFLWTDAKVSANLMVLYAGGLYSSILAIFIFRDFNETGTELLIYSKPIARRTITIYKFLCFVTFGLLFSLVAGIMGIAIFAFPGVSYQDGTSLIVSLITGNFILILVFGFIGIIVTMFLNKVWTNLINICIVVIFMIFHMVSSFTVKTPSQLISEEPGLGLDSFWYMDKNGEMKYGAQLSSREQYVASDGQPVPYTTKINTIDDVVSAYAVIDGKSKTETSNIFDIVQQFDSMFNIGSLESRKEKNAYESFGNNKWFNYKISENSPVFSENFPLSYVSGVQHDGWNALELSNLNYELKETVKMLGSPKLTMSMSIFDDSDKLYVAKAYSGYTKFGETNYYTPNELIFKNKDQKDWLNEFLFNDKGVVVDDLPFVGLLTRDNSFGDKKYFSSLYDRSAITDSLYEKFDKSFYNYIHDAIISTISPTPKNVFLELQRDPTPANLAIAVIQLKFNMYVRIVNRLNDECYLKNITNGEEKFVNLQDVIKNPPAGSGFPILPDIDKDILCKPNGRPLNPIRYKDEDGKYFTEPWARRGRALLDEYITAKETFGYTSTEPRGWDREKDHFTSMITSFEMPLYKTYQNTFFSFNVKAIFSTGDLWFAWGIISLLLMGIAITIYYRTDFK